MKRKIKTLGIVLMAAMSVGLLMGCSADQTAYEKNNEDGYTVSVRYDANGGFFTTNTSVITDSFNLSEMKENQDGEVEISLISPDNSLRGNDAFAPVKNGYFLAGWYATRIESTDENGETVYTYGDKWDFDSDILAVAKDGEYSSQTPVMTLYAAWVPMFEIDFYSLSDGELIGSYTYDPTTAEVIKVPSWNEETGAVEMYRFPQKNGYTFEGVYYDADGKEAVNTETIVHPGTVDYANGIAQNETLKLYVDYVEGEWFHIYTAEQFVENASVTGCYEIHADLDFADEIWPTAFMHGNFAGKINGNGYTFKNIEAKQTNNSKTNSGLFGMLTEQAAISDLTFENVSFTIQAGTRVAGSSYGLFAGTISDAAAITNVSIVNGTLKIDSKCYFGADDYAIGLVCGMGNSDVIGDAQIVCDPAGDNPENVQITVNGNQVTVEIVTP